MQNRFVESRVRGVTVPFPIAIGQVEFDCAAARIFFVEGDRGIDEIRAGFAVPGAELNNTDALARNGLEVATEIAGKPPGLQLKLVL